MAENTYIDTSYGFAEISSQQKLCLELGTASGCYDVPCFIIGPAGKITVGDFTVLNASKLICNQRIDIGNHCMLAWNSVVTDSWLDTKAWNAEHRRAVLEHTAYHPERRLIPGAESQPVILEDNCWLGFGAVVMPGVRVGRGAIIASKTIVLQNVPAYTIVAGSPARIVRNLEADDTVEAQIRAFKEYIGN